jgi:hypothetical protein
MSKSSLRRLECGPKMALCAANAFGLLDRSSMQLNRRSPLASLLRRTRRLLEKSCKRGKHFGLLTS